jgi:uncharacterized protein
MVLARVVATFFVLGIFLFAAGCHTSRKESSLNASPEMTEAITALRGAYAAFNRGDIDAAVAPLDPQIEWTEPAEFPGGGTYNGREGVKQYLTQSRVGAAEVISEPEQFIVAGDRIVVFVYARVLPKGGGDWKAIHLADVYTIRDGKIVAMRAFANREDALRWVEVESPAK